MLVILSIVSVQVYEIIILINITKIKVNQKFKAIY